MFTNRSEAPGGGRAKRRSRRPHMGTAGGFGARGARDFFAGGPSFLRGVLRTAMRPGP